MLETIDSSYIFREMGREYFGFPVCFLIDDDQKLKIVCNEEQAWDKLEELDMVCDWLVESLYNWDVDGMFELKNMKQIVKLTRVYLSEKEHRASSSSPDDETEITSFCANASDNKEKETLDHIKHDEDYLTKMTIFILVPQKTLLGVPILFVPF